MRRVLLGFFLAVLLTVFVFGIGFAAQGGGKQIVFMAGDSDIEFTAVTIQGYNQRNTWSTWTRTDSNGFTVAYTKNWWWVADFVQITFTMKDSLGQETSDVCLIDVLEQPADAPRVVIVYSVENGCVGGEAGNVQDPVSQAFQPVRDAFATIDYYLPDDKFDFMMRVIYNELNATGCVLGLSSILYTRGYIVLDDTAREYISQTCQETAQMVMSLFPSN